MLKKDFTLKEEMNKDFKKEEEADEERREYENY